MKLFSLLLAALLFLPALARGDALSDWMDLEQTRIDRSVDNTKILAPDVANQQSRFRPESRNWFPLQSVWVPEEELHHAVQEEAIAPELRALFVKEENGRRYFRLLIHPESEQFYSKLLAKYPAETAFEASSTASSRTVLVRPIGARKPAFFAKLSLDVKLGGVTRTIPQGEVARSVGTSRYLRALEKARPGGRFHFLPEVLGIAPKGWERGGMILRQIPETVTESRTHLVPLFSLYAKDEGGHTLLEQMAKRAGKKPADFVAEKILAPFYEGWVDWNVRGAVTMEAHAQNVLLAVDDQGLPTGEFFHRDLGGFNVRIADQSLLSPEGFDVFTSLENDYHQASSAKARNQSLRTYFDGGFLFNVDKELARLDPAYRPGSIQERGYRILGEKLAAASGLRLSPAELSALRAGKQGMAPVLEKAAANAAAAQKPRPFRGCPGFFSFLAAGSGR